MRFNDAYPSKWLAADDLDNGDLTVTIRDEEPTEWVEFSQPGSNRPDRKPVLYFKVPRGTKPLVLNKTNFKAISDVLGTDETEEWAGQSITLYATEVESFGEMKMGIRIRLRKPKTVAKKSGVIVDGKTFATMDEGRAHVASARVEPEERDDDDPTPF